MLKEEVTMKCCMIYACKEMKRKWKGTFKDYITKKSALSSLIMKILVMLWKLLIACNFNRSRRSKTPFIQYPKNGLRNLKFKS